MQSEKLNAGTASQAAVVQAGGNDESLFAHGDFVAECHDKDGNLIWREEYHNLVTTVGKNDMLDKYLTGSAYTGTFYLGLIGAVSYTAIAATDTMASHSGWTEAGGTNAPTFSQSARPTAAWNAASAGAKAFSGALTFNITGTGTVKGSLLTTSPTKDGTAGILFSAGLFTGGDQPVVNTNIVTVSYSLSI
jgi:hypothetical protein